MKNCPNCHGENEDGAAFCCNCGAPMNGQPAYQPPYQAPVNPYDHTKDFEKQDIADNKLFAMCGYLLSIPGLIVALLAAGRSPYTMFHVRQSLRIAVLNVILSVASVLLAWTVLAPIAAFVCMGILLVVRVIGFVDVCKGKAVELWAVRSMKFLK